MPAPRVLVLRAPGTNCDEETALAFELAGGVACRVHINRLFESPRLLDAYQILCIPGGFSYGDDIAAGRILALELRSRLRDVLDSFIARDRLVLGVCNGFQVLLQTGLLLDADDAGAVATLAWNRSGRFEDRWVRVACDASASPMLHGIDTMYLPIAHAEGRFATRDDEVLKRLRAAGQMPIRYAPLDGRGEVDSLDYPDNPNGSAGNVAGVCNPGGRILGLMPHPERHVSPMQHPWWTRRRQQPEEGDGLRLFRNAVGYFAVGYFGQ